MIAGLGLSEILVIILILALIFGSHKIPELTRNLGRGIMDFKHSLSAEDDAKTNGPSVSGEEKI